MSFHATIRIEDEDGIAVCKFSGRAEKVLAKSLNYINQKDGGDSLLKRMTRYLSEDLKALDIFLKKDFEALSKILTKK